MSRTQPARGKAKRVGRWLLRIFSLVMLGALGLALWAWWMVESTPAYWFPPIKPTERVAQQAAAFEKWLPERFSEVRPYGEPWQIAIETDAVNEWLAARMGKWAANQGIGLPEQLEGTVFTLHGGRLIVAGMLNQDGKQRVVSAAFKAYNGEAGDVAELRLDGMYVGKLRVPLEAVLDLGERFDDPEKVRRIRAVHEQVERVTLDFELDEVRRVQITNVALQEGKVVLTCRTVLR